MNHVDAILKVLQNAGSSLKLRKCDLFSDTVKYLGQIISPGTLAIYKEHVKSLEKLQHSTTITELRSFFCCCNLYRRFVTGYTDIYALKISSSEKSAPLKRAANDARYIKPEAMQLI